VETAGIERKIYGTLRIACAMCFIGHGVFGIITKPIWCNYFGVFGIGHDMAYSLMPYIGIMDISMGCIHIILSFENCFWMAYNLGNIYCNASPVIGRAICRVH
jgi:hypothetical protein